MDKTWRSRVFGQGRTRSGGPRLCADRSGAKNSTPLCVGWRWIRGRLNVEAEESHEEVQTERIRYTTLATQYSIA